MNEAPNLRRLQLMEGGPTYRLQKRLGLIRANSPRIVRRALLSILITWVPLAVLAAIQGHAMQGTVAVPFLNDFAVHARFLLAVPLLLLAETILGPRLAAAASHFVEGKLIIGQDLAKFDDAIERGLGWRDSVVAECILILLAYAITAVTLAANAIHVSTWYALRTGSQVSLTWAGWWFVLFCVPLLQFLTLRWLWRFLLWAQFLWRTSKLNLQLTPTHPDEAGGLAFVGESQRFFGVILFAYSIAVAGVLANEVIYDQISLRSFAPAIAAYVLIAVALVVLPLCVFTKMLKTTRRHGLYEYATLATEYTSQFHQRWIVSASEPDQELLGTGDIQSLADLGNSFTLIEKMNSIPMGPRTPIHLAMACLLPVAPLLLTMMPVEELLKMIFKVIL